MDDDDGTHHRRPYSNFPSGELVNKRKPIININKSSWNRNNTI